MAYNFRLNSNLRVISVICLTIIKICGKITFVSTFLNVSNGSFLSFVIMFAKQKSIVLCVVVSTCHFVSRNDDTDTKLYYILSKSLALYARMKHVILALAGKTWYEIILHLLLSNYPFCTLSSFSEFMFMGCNFNLNLWNYLLHEVENCPSLFILVVNFDFWVLKHRFRSIYPASRYFSGSTTQRNTHVVDFDQAKKMRPQYLMVKQCPRV